MTENLRCEVCGDELGVDSGELVRIDKGALQEGKKRKPRFVREESWGYAHHECFSLAVGDPEAVVDILAESA